MEIKSKKSRSRSEFLNDIRRRPNEVTGSEEKTLASVILLLGKMIVLSPESQIEGKKKNYLAYKPVRKFVILSNIKLLFGLKY